MSEPERLGNVIKELMVLFKQRRKIEGRIQAGQASEDEREKLEALNRRVQE